MNSESPRKLPHFLCGANPTVLRRALRHYGPVESDYVGRWRKIRAASLSLAPWTTLESLRYGRQLRSFRLRDDPVFIIGHWQAGHSVMHHLLLQDQRFASVQLLHCALPGCFRTLTRPVGRLLRRRLPQTRGVDTLPLSLSAPQGDDFLLAGLTDLSLYYGYVFPAEYDTVLKRALLFEGVSGEEIQAWQELYYHALKRVAASQQKSWLVSRNASNTTRIPQLLEMFPRARFIHLCRSPLDVFAAQQSRLTALTGRWCLQRPDPQQFERSTLDFFVTMMERYFRDSPLIPAGQLIEVRYEDLLADPARVLRQVYEVLNLGDFPSDLEALPAGSDATQGRLAGDASGLPAETVQRVRNRWGDIIGRLGY